jgi:ATP-dependent Clp protease ATP-binding subunit ClpC
VATLHVRNVPDQLYETLRATAELEGRSIGAQAVALLQQGLKADVAVRQKLRRRLGAGPSFVRDARRAVVLAQEEVRTLGHAEVGTEHLLLGLLRPGAKVAAALSKPPLVIDVDEVRRRVVELRPPAAEPPTGQIPFTPGAKKALEQALREALALKDRHIGPEHVLLGIAAVEEDPGARILADLGADLDTLRAALVLSLASGKPYITAARPPFVEPDAEWSYRAVALTGSAEDWTACLNELAADGWELVSIVGEAGEPRAVFRRLANEAD